MTEQTSDMKTYKTYIFMLSFDERAATQMCIGWKGRRYSLDWVGKTCQARLFSFLLSLCSLPSFKVWDRNPLGRVLKRRSRKESDLSWICGLLWGRRVLVLMIHLEEEGRRQRDMWLPGMLRVLQPFSSRYPVALTIVLQILFWLNPDNDLERLPSADKKAVTVHIRVTCRLLFRAV